MNAIVPYFRDDQVRDLVLILPGGGYAFCSSREAKPVADVFLKEGYHAAVFEYRREILAYPALYDEAIRLIGRFGPIRGSIGSSSSVSPPADTSPDCF